MSAFWCKIFGLDLLTPIGVRFNFLATAPPSDSAYHNREPSFFVFLCSRLTWYLGVFTDDISEGWLPTQECYGPAVVQSQEVHPDAKAHLYPFASDCTAIAPDPGWILWRSSLTNPLFVLSLYVGRVAHFQVI